MTIKVSTSIISIQSINQLLSFFYDINEIICSELLQSTVHDTYLIKTATSKYIFKVFKYESKSKVEINFEINFVNYLRTMQINVSKYLINQDDNYISEINAPEGKRYAVLTTYSEGKELKYENNSDAFEYGVSVGKLHKISQNFKLLKDKKEININKMFLESINIIKIFFENTNYLSFFENFEKAIKIKMEHIDFDTLKTVVCHGDLHGGNANKDLNIISFYDFDFCGYGFISYDISVFRWGCMIGKRHHLWKDFIKGYKSVKVLNDTDLENTLLFVAIRDLWIMSLYLNRVEKMGKLFISDLYIKNRINFLKNIQERL